MKISTISKDRSRASDMAGRFLSKRQCNIVVTRRHAKTLTSQTFYAKGRKGFKAVAALQLAVVMDFSKPGSRASCSTVCMFFACVKAQIVARSRTFSPTSFLITPEADNEDKCCITTFYYSPFAATNMSWIVSIYSIG